MFKKSTSVFEKTNNRLKYSILFSWDGRGGITFLNELSGIVEIPAIAKASHQLLAYTLPAQVNQPKKDDAHLTYPIPQMYSRKLIELANDMKFKEMAAMSFEEKYPMEKIAKTAEMVSKFILHEVVPFHNTYTDEKQILDFYLLSAEKRYRENDLFNISYFVFPAKLMCKKLGIAEPDFLRDINLFTNQSVDELWNMQHHDFQNMEEKFNTLKFKD
ncbi:MAG: hypothetical protein IT269_04890 [Saprospiraceae bacterium]|nr:hypothetical protein [Saprospiraceae bacterium]